MTATDAASGTTNLADGADREIITSNQRVYQGYSHFIIAGLCIAYTAFHIGVMNLYPLETWVYRLSHVTGGLMLGFLLFSAGLFNDESEKPERMPGISLAIGIVAGALVLLALGQILYAILANDLIGAAPRRTPENRDAYAQILAQHSSKYLYSFGYPLFGGTVLAVLGSWLFPGRARHRISATDIVLVGAALAVGMYIIAHAGFLRLRASVVPHPNDMWAAIVGIILILELTRRLAGLALVVIVSIFILYGFVGPWLPGFLESRAYPPARFFAFIYTDNGILGPTTAVSSTYIILFITFAAFLQASRVGEYFINFAFAAAGGTRGGPAKVAVFGSALMGMINGTSAGNVVSTGSLTIPLMKKVGYKPQTAASVEAAASSGGQILPPIMGAGAFIMAEITAIPYRDIVIAAIIPAILYFTSVYFMVDKEALKKGMKGLPREELPEFAKLAKQAFLFIPIVILIGALFVGYSVIRAGTLSMAAAAVVSWLTPHRMGVRSILYALEIAAKMSLQLVAVCAAAGVIVGVIALTGVGGRLSGVLSALAGQSQFLALFFAMCVAIILGMGMPTTAAYAVAASVIAPGLIRLGIEPLTAHFFIFYYAVMSAITPPVALAAYAGAAIAQSDPMRTSVESFKIGLAAFVVPFMFFYSSTLLMQGEWLGIAHDFVSACFGIYLLASAVQGWMFGRLNVVLRLIVGAAALAMIAGGWTSDAIGLVTAGVVFLIQRKLVNPQTMVKGAD